ncbi:hypothetical protein VP01_1216g3 [Puccinia sorghi]|uniref:Uncharacterized protein n=1 Tax=Puccinia sorghi TaxID=27349 RepID=A0A0L6VRN4_9BASI|nr:hypothetical protein VP01_1216g3 [Puccinia sorghi]
MLQHLPQGTSFQVEKVRLECWLDWHGIKSDMDEETFRHQLYDHALARNLQNLNSAAARHVVNEFRCCRLLIHHFKLSNEPCKIGDQLLFKSKLVYSESEALRRLKLNSYLANVAYPLHWWPEDFSKDCRQFGPDPLTILKVGDALQFGSRNLIPDAPLLPWRESPERAWLITKKRQLISNCRIGYELGWFDLGWDIKLYMQLMQLTYLLYRDFSKVIQAFTEEGKLVLNLWLRRSILMTEKKNPTRKAKSIHSF